MYFLTDSDLYQDKFYYNIWGYHKIARPRERRKGIGFPGLSLHCSVDSINK